MNICPNGLFATGASFKSVYTKVGGLSPPFPTLPLSLPSSFPFAFSSFFAESCFLANMLVPPPKSEFFELKSDYPGATVPPKRLFPGGFPKGVPEVVGAFEKRPPVLLAPPKRPPPPELLLLIQFAKSPVPVFFFSPLNRDVPDGLLKREGALAGAVPPKRPEPCFCGGTPLSSFFASSLSLLSVLLLIGFAPNNPVKGVESLN